MALDVGQRRPQFVRHIRYHGATLTLRFLQSVGHRVECLAQFRYFIVAFNVSPAGQVSTSQPSGGGGQTAD